jgi:hypothetical protein
MNFRDSKIPPSDAMMVQLEFQADLQIVHGLEFALMIKLKSNDDSLCPGIQLVILRRTYLGHQAGVICNHPVTARFAISDYTCQLAEDGKGKRGGAEGDILL